MAGLRAAFASAALALLLIGPVAAHAEVIDRILAVVDRELITLSDVSAAIRLGLVAAPQGGADPVRGALDALVARQLELGEANRYQPPEPPAADVQARLDVVKARFASPAQLQQVLVESGLTEDQLQLRVRDDLRIDAYLSQRFGSSRLPSEQELLDYYRTHASDFAAPAGPRPFADVRDDVRQRVTTAQRATLVNEWLDGLRRRTEIADLYVVAAK